MAKKTKKEQREEKGITFHNGQFRASIGYEIKGADLTVPSIGFRAEGSFAHRAIPPRKWPRMSDGDTPEK